MIRPRAENMSAFLDSLKPCLTYEVPFVQKDLNKIKLYVCHEDSKKHEEESQQPGTRANNQESTKEYTRSQYTSMLEGKSVEEVLFIIKNFENLSDDLQMAEAYEIKQRLFQTLLGSEARDKWEKMKKATDPQSWKQAKLDFIWEYTDD